MDGPLPGPQSHPGVKVSHTRSKSAPSSRPRDNDSDTDNSSDIINNIQNGNSDDSNGLTRDQTDSSSVRHSVRSHHGGNSHHQNGNSIRKHGGSSDDMLNEHYYDLPEGEDYMAIYETIDRKRQETKDLKVKSASMEELETPTPSVKSFNMNADAVTANCKAEPQIPREKKRHRSKSGSKPELRKSIPETSGVIATPSDPVGDGMAQFLKKALKIEGPQLSQKTVTIRKNVRESLGMRIGGGIGSNEGDTPIYIANIHPHGCIGKSKQLKVKKKIHTTKSKCCQRPAHLYP